jgi:hypothetical protein
MWLKPKQGAVYAGVCKRTFQKWLKMGLPHCRLPSSTVLVKKEWIDEYLERFKQDGDEIEKAVKEVVKKL